MTDEQPPQITDRPAGAETAGLPDRDSHEGRAGTHSASHGARQVGGTRADRNIVVFGLGMLLCAILIAFLPDLVSVPATAATDHLHGRIVTVVPGGVVAPSATVTILDGDRRGDVVTATLEGPSGAVDLPGYRTGDEVVVAIDAQPDGSLAYAVVDRWRLPIVGLVLAGFALALIAIAGWAGLRALTSLAITLAVVVRLLVPLLLAGYDPVVLAVGLGIAVTAITLMLTHGLTRATGAAIAGTTLGLLVTAALAGTVTAGAQFSLGQGSQQIVALGQLLGSSIDLSGLLLAAVIFGGLGVLADVAVTQAVTVEEFGRLDPNASARGLYRRAMPVGLAHLAAAVNTLVLAYVGAALPVVVILALQVHRLDLVLNDEHVAVEVVRTFVGALGVISAVPLTTGIAALWVTRAHHARRRGARIMATSLAGPAKRLSGWDRFGLRERLARRGAGRSDLMPWARTDIAPLEPSGRRRSARPAVAPPESTGQTLLPFIEPPAEIEAADSVAEPEAAPILEHEAPPEGVALPGTEPARSTESTP